MGAHPADALMIGDTPTDFEAARQAGIPFLGHARNEFKGNVAAPGGRRVRGAFVRGRYSTWYGGRNDTVTPLTSVGRASS
ncbi:HAD family hydrolase [Streptomyces sp. L7]